ncbi:hypothetical protein BCR33DRAFT_528853 [Rhizoclosmatium globosum]|uniref:CBS domain-containing protein n=1 Tax=Rhizoclosmatium globosum TaxID=329046 RepID=A0A1Y2CU48_9FUNG|nr:hypothetical protein BCR33DRAFT_528853 [Rhizoclosmatium globosum]|eukprot:ORY50416.1 hypothetical protein BCR33DRAFT_528853 [Rhizoclosmatium globosum]
MIENDTLISLIKSKPLVDIEAHASVATALEVMKVNKVTALVVYGLKDHWLGAGNSNLCIGQKQLIGLITILDVILHLSSKHLETSATNYTDLISQTRVVDIIGKNEESMSLWVGDTHSKLKFALEPLSKGVHRFLVPIYPPTSLENPHPKPIDFQLCSQSDVIAQFAPLIESDIRFKPLAATPVSSFCSSSPILAKRSDPVLPLLTSLASMNLMAVPVVDHEGILADTLSASDFKSVLEGDVSIVQDIIKAITSGMTVGDFLGLVSRGKVRVLKGVVSPGVSFGEAVSKISQSRIHRLWVVDAFGVPIGVLSLGDMIRGILSAL